ncbi:MAG: cation transporter [Verrucomicrobiae bacterium]|nr:cation transporter [Verrucomicrobiae bacterium]
MRKWIALAAVTVLAAVAAQAETVNLKIEGMSCPHGCVAKVDAALAKVKGVTARKVELGKAEVTFDEKQTSKKEIATAIKKAGFKVVN